jgi:hypothetical protein
LATLLPPLLAAFLRDPAELSRALSLAALLEQLSQPAKNKTGTTFIYLAGIILTSAL